jgi:hypothetical protein
MLFKGINDCVISGFRRGENEIFALLGCYAAYLVTDVSGQPTGPIIFLDCLTLEDEIDTSSRNVSK